MTKGSSMFPTKVRSLFLRRSSGSATSTRSKDSSASSTNDQSPTNERHRRPKSSRSRSSLAVPKARPSTVDETLQEEEELPEPPRTAPESSRAAPVTTQLSLRPNINTNTQPTTAPIPLPTPDPSPLSPSPTQQEANAPTVTVQVPSPPENHRRDLASEPSTASPASPSDDITSTHSRAASPRNIQFDTGSRPRPVSAGRRSLLESRPRSPLYQSFVAREQAGSSGQAGAFQGQGELTERSSRDFEPSDYFSASPSTYASHPQTPSNMAHSPNRHPQAYAQPRKRRIWVKRPGASATMVTINDDDMVDDARDMILRKYANSLGKSFDSPDVTLRIHPREQPHSSSQRSSSAQQMTPSPLQEERVLRPDEVLSRTLDVYFPGGQSVEEALLIDVPPPPPSHRSRRTPRHSPGVFNSHAGFANHHEENYRPSESDKDYFTAAVLAPGRGGTVAHSPGAVGQPIMIGHGGHPSIAVINGAQLPSIPSPGAAERAIGGPSGEGRRAHTRRPKVGRTHTSSPTIVQTTSHLAETRPNIAATASIPPPPLGTPPHPGPGVSIARAATPPARVSSPRPAKAKRPKKQSTVPGPLATPGLSNILATVPPINVLVVEDNIINLRLLEAFLKRLKVRSHSAMNGREAVNKWRQGGFHLVLMDIQLPVMNGLDATKEIRRLEKVNGVGAFVKSVEEERAEKGRQSQEAAEQSEPPTPQDEEKEKERNQLGNRELFKSPVIIVALTASSLHSDRSEALAAGCNDFLTKPVNLSWLERKLKEWGCMQALIDFDGWRQWKDFQSTPADVAVGKGASKAGHRSSTSGSGLKIAQRSEAAAIDKPVPSSTDKAAVASGATAPPTNNPTTAALEDLNARTESQDSTTTLDSMTSDSGDSMDTAMPARPAGRAIQGVTSPIGPNVSVQSPTPRPSVEGANLPRVDTAVPGTRSTSVSPKVGSSAVSPRSMSSLSLSSGGDGQADVPSDRERSVERRRRAKRSSMGQSGLTAVEEREGEESRGEVQVGA